VWFERYRQRFENARLPKEQSQREQLALRIGQDGLHLLNQIHAATDPSHLQSLLALETLRCVWVQPYYLNEQTQKRATNICHD
jgi:hypothetical protein